MDRIRTVFLGLSNHAEERLLPALKSSAQFSLDCVVSRDVEKAQRFQQQFSAMRSAANWWEEISRQTCDAVLVSGPPAFHEAVVARCLAEHLPVFVEKPCARSLPAMRALASAATLEPSVPTFVGYNFRYADLYLHLSKIARELGGIRHLDIHFCTNKPKTPLWDYPSVFESFLYAIAIHPIEMAISLIGHPLAVRVDCGQLSENVFRLTLTLIGTNDRSVTLYLGNYAPRFRLRYVLVTSTGYKLILDSVPNQRFTVVEGPKNGLCDSEITERMMPTLATALDYGYRQELDSFAMAIRTNSPSSSPLQQSVPVYEVIQTILSEYSSFK